MENMDFLKKEYLKLKDSYLKIENESSSDYLGKFRRDILAQVLYVWSKEPAILAYMLADGDVKPGVCDAYMEALSVMYEGDGSGGEDFGGKALDKEEIQSILKRVCHKDYLTITPAFVNMVAAEVRGGDVAGKNGDAAEAGDGDAGGKIGKEFVKDLITFLTDMAFVDGNCTVAEADAIEKTRQVYMDFYNHFMGNVEGICRGTVKPGTFKYKNYGAEIDYVLDGKVGERESGSSKSQTGKNRDAGSGLSVLDLADGLDLRGRTEWRRKAAERTAGGAADIDLSETEMIEKTVNEITRMMQEDFGVFAGFEGLGASGKSGSAGKTGASGKSGGSDGLNVTGKFDASNKPSDPGKFGDSGKTGASGKSDAGDNTNAEKSEKDTRLKQANESKEEVEPEKTFDELMAELDSLVGLDAVKKDIHTMINFLKVCQLRKERGLKAPELSQHMVFSGNPGTGKTTIARLLSKMYKQIGLLKTGQLVEVDRSGLIAAYQGQTAIKTAEVIQSALGGVLFIDEAYSLVQGDNDSYGKECIATVLKAMEDHRDELVVIVAGYDDLMNKFIESNPGLQSRFNKYIHFPDYTGEELQKIFLLQCKNNGYKLEAAAERIMGEVFNKMYEMRDKNFGNGRTVRNTFEKIINCQATRLAAADGAGLTNDELMRLVVADVKAGLGMEL